MFDGGIWIGRNPTNGNSLDTKEFIKHCDHYGIQKAFISHYKSIYYNTLEGNAELLQNSKELAGRAIPVPVISPQIMDFDDHCSYLDSLHKDQVSFLGVYSDPHYLVLNLESILLEDVLNAAIEKDFALSFSVSTSQEFATVVRKFAGKASKMLIRYVGSGKYYELSEIAHAISRHPSLYVDVRSIVGTGQLDHLVNQCGAEKLFVSSFYPESFPLCGRSLIEHSSLSDSEKERILFGTLAEVSKDSSKNESLKLNLGVQKQLDKIASAKKIDTHFHIHGWNTIEPKIELEEIEKTRQQFNYEKLIVSPILSLNYDNIKGNQEVFEAVEKYNWLYGLIVLDPLRIDITLKQIDQYSNHPKCVGLKTIQDLYGLRLDADEYLEIFKYAESANLPIMAHIPGMLEAAKLFPKTSFICAHSTWGRISYMLNQENVFFDLATSHDNNAESQLERLIAKVEDRILYASDGQLISPAWTLGKLASTKLSDKQLEGILHNNALRAFPKLN